MSHTKDRCQPKPHSKGSDFSESIHIHCECAEKSTLGDKEYFYSIIELRMYKDPKKVRLEEYYIRITTFFSQPD